MVLDLCKQMIKLESFSMNYIDIFWPNIKILINKCTLGYISAILRVSKQKFLRKQKILLIKLEKKNENLKTDEV